LSAPASSPRLDQVAGAGNIVRWLCDPELVLVTVPTCHGPTLQGQHDPRAAPERRCGLAVGGIAADRLKLDSAQTRRRLDANWAVSSTLWTGGRHPWARAKGRPRVGSLRWIVRVAIGDHPRQPATENSLRWLPSGRVARSPRAHE